MLLDFRGKSIDKIEQTDSPSVFFLLHKNWEIEEVDIGHGYPGWFMDVWNTKSYGYGT